MPPIACYFSFDIFYDFRCLFFFFSFALFAIDIRCCYYFTPLIELLSDADDIADY